MNIQQAIARIITGQHLEQEETRQVMDQIMSGGASDAQIGAYLTALRMKGETVFELAGSAQAMRDKVVRVSSPGRTVDTCGTGGDGLGTFNISTTAAFVVAGCGVTVAKHGNRAISSKSGSADVLTALGVRVDAPPGVIEGCLKEVGLGFLFAPNHHGAMKHAARARQELGIRTMFNLLGPLTNPAGASCQLLGVYDARWTEPLALVLGRLGSHRAMVVHGLDGLDEITTTTTTRISELAEDGLVTTYTVEPEQFGLSRATLEDLRGGDAKENAAITLAILEGQSGPKQEIVLLNAGAALYVSGRVATLQAGVDLARDVLASGEAKARLDQLIKVSHSET